MWINIFRQHYEEKGPKKVAGELGVSRASVDLIYREEYNASTRNFEKKVENIYGRNGKVQCAALGEISPVVCADKWNLAKKIGMMAGNPETLRLYKTCINCSVRGK